MANPENGRAYLERFGLTDNSVMALSPHLQGYECSEADVVDMAKGLVENWSLTSLELSRCNVTFEGANALAEALLVNHTLRYLGVSHNPLGDSGAEALAGALADNQSLEILDLSHCGIRDHGALALSQMLELQPEVTPSKKCGELRSLLLAGNRIGKAGAAALGAALTQTSKLKTLDLSSNRLREAGACAVAVGIAENKSLTDLNLGNNDINPEGCLALVEAMRVNRSISTLNLHRNRFGAAVVGFAEISNTNTVLRVLNLEKTCIDPEAAMLFAENLLQPSLLSVNFGLNPLGNDGVKHLCGALRGKPIRYLDFSEVGLTPQGIDAVCELVNLAPCLQTLQLDNNTLNAHCISELCRSLKHNDTIDSLNLENTGMGQRGAQLLADSLANNITFRSLDISDNKIGDVGCVAICSTLARMRRLSELDLSYNDIRGGDGTLAALCSVFSNNTGLAKVKLEGNPVAADFPGGMLTRALAVDACPQGLPDIEPFAPMRSIRGECDLIESRGGAVQPGAAGVKCATHSLFRPAWSPAVPQPRVYGDEAPRSVEEEDEELAEDGHSPPLIPGKGSLLHPLYPGYGRGRMSNECHADTLETVVPLPIHQTKGHHEQQYNPNQTTSMTLFSEVPRRALKKSPFSLDRLENNIGGLPITEEALRQKFMELDVDGSGYLDYNEFKIIFSNFQNFGVYQSQVEVDNIMKKYKIMDDGKITFDEFCLIMLSLAKR